jgi:hypothetical protein
MNGYCRSFALSLSKPVLSRPKGANLILLGTLYYSDLLDNEDQVLPTLGIKRSATPLLHQR